LTGDIAGALDVLVDALQIGEAFWPEMGRRGASQAARRVAATLVVPHWAEVEACFYKALAIPRKQGSRAFELRAVVSQVQLLSEQGRSSEARHLLAPVYGWFTEGFDTSDFGKAKALRAGMRRGLRGAGALLLHMLQIIEQSFFQITRGISRSGSSGESRSARGGRPRRGLRAMRRDWFRYGRDLPLIAMTSRRRGGTPWASASPPDLLALQYDAAAARHRRDVVELNDQHPAVVADKGDSVAAFGLRPAQ